MYKNNSGLIAKTKVSKFKISLCLTEKLVLVNPLLFLYETVGQHLEKLPSKKQTDILMKINKIITSYETSIKLKNAGYLKTSIFSYFEDNNNEIYISETDFSKDKHIVFAYTSSELIETLPNSLQINTENFVVKDNTYTNITEEEIIENNGVAELKMQKINHNNGENEFMTKYSIGERMIAFSRNLKGEYKNLICFGNSEAESRGKMVLTLIEEGKIKNVAQQRV